MKNQLISFDYSYNNDVLDIKYKPISRELKPWNEEMVTTIKNIYASTNRPLYLCMSGGIDGELLALIMLEHNIPFTVLIVKYKNGENQHDYHYALDFCEKNKINTVSIYIDSFEFYNKTIYRYIEQGYKAVKMFKYLQIFMLETIENMGGCGIITGGEQVYCNVEGELCLHRDYGYVTAVEWCKNNNTVHYPIFGEQNPEVFASWYKVDLIEFLLKDPSYFNDWSDNMSIEKIMINHRFWPSMRRRNKYNGYEAMYGMKNIVEDKLKLLFPDIKTIYLPVKKIKQQLGV